MPSTFCKLCQKEAPLRNSHVIPELLYRRIYDEKHRALADDASSDRARLIQQGYREPMLCEDCEQRFGKLESHFAREWCDARRLPATVQGLFVAVHGLDFERMRRFHISLLWRASVSQHRTFSGVDLGPHERRIAEYLLAEPSQADDVPVSIFAFVLFQPPERSLADWVITLPTRTRIKGVRAYVVAFSGCSWYYFVARQPPPFPPEFALSREGSLVMPAISYAQSGQFRAIWDALSKRPSKPSRPTTLAPSC